jgi:hypothetical protein
MPQIRVVNRSRNLSDDLVAVMTEAVNIQFSHHFLPAWDTADMEVVFNSKSRKKDVWTVALFDTSHQWEFHHSRPSSAVFVQGAIDHGSMPLTGPYALSMLLSHECLELAIDPHVAQWSVTGVDRSGQSTCVAYDIANPVDNQFYEVIVNGSPVNVSNFVLPAWFDQRSVNMKTDALDMLDKKALLLTSGGYTVTWGAGGQEQTYGEEMPHWRLKQKRCRGSRGFRRMMSHHFRMV